ncbi:MAG: moderate conductance mechanosensitive channel, partial [Actinomycetota bacterium]|nr:moderate conductance mechanosensitive channel [Actinomycetota bacterium]
TGNSITIRVIIKCKPNEHFAVQRELRERIKEAFDREGIRLPVPVYPGAPTPGSAPAGPT